MAAGLGFKTFTSGEVLTAADTNGYLMQGILVFATEAARNSAITSPQEGQFAFTKDTNSLWYYTGSAWAASGATGDIEGVTAGTGITGGGTSGTVTITNDMATTITAAGDIVVGTGSGTYDNLPIGTTAQVLTADTTVSPYKVKWATPAAAASGLTLIKRATVSAAASTTTVFDGMFTNTYQNYLIVIENAFGSTGATLRFQWRLAAVTQAGGNYYGVSTSIDYSGSTVNILSSAATFMGITTLGTSAGDGAAAQMTVTNVRNAAAPVIYGNSTSISGSKSGFLGTKYAVDASLDGFILSLSTGNITCTVSVYGLAIV